jgi:hypothetical protein
MSELLAGGNPALAWVGVFTYKIWVSTCTPTMLDLQVGWSLVPSLVKLGGVSLLNHSPAFPQGFDILLIGTLVVQLYHAK